MPKWFVPVSEDEELVGGSPASERGIDAGCDLLGVPGTDESGRKRRGRGGDASNWVKSVIEGSNRIGNGSRL
jgi:hypothetical protein